MATLEPETGKVLLPDGRALKDVSSSELSSLLMNLNVPGVTSEQGHQEQASRYAAFLAIKSNAAGQQAIADWLNGRAKP
jgi:hypothetical protein